MTNTHPRGADMLVRAIRQAGVKTIFSLSGNHIMPVYDAILSEGLQIVHTRHEGAAVHMADAWARLSGGVGLALVTGGPGHANAISALYTAAMSESPVILLSGHAPLSQLGEGAFQEMDQVAMAQPVVKAAWAASDPDTIAADFAKACRIALSGRPGPVHLSLPTDVLEKLATSDSLPGLEAYRPQAVPLGEAEASGLMARLAQAARPLILVGPQGLTDAGRAAVARLQQAGGVPVVASESPRGSNDPSLGAFAPVLSQADCVLLVGKRLDFTLGFGRNPTFSAECVFLQVDADSAEFERSARAVGSRLLATHQADVPSALAALALVRQEVSQQASQWRQQVELAVAYRPPAWKKAESSREQALHPVQVFEPVQAILDSHPDATLVVDGGEIGQWAQACLTAPHRIINGAAGAIGAALPMAIAAQLAYPSAPVIAVMGDGTFGFHCAELDTALRYGAPMLCVIGNDARWNAEYQIQVRSYGADRTIGCELLPSRYERVCQAFGGHGEYVEQAGDLAGALQSARASGLPACVNVSIDGLPAPVIRQA
ncbi:thiamine pyrophosphate-binding protein [Pusillimonas sp. MFBS29]|uniref:thiamine pyrophosphate-binding protein n=1 Tax=Pusillimonas sp. MFBS29 TaxID=2886690 RepID=UPI001D0FAA59|nr:thiamine pyrophosphate-binding protein [Pusillimonas sp. MFBS29]MCC2597630.1 thiamine pyrophosphate-binding protein [Pusillimonas sp. MFBS29]